MSRTVPTIDRKRRTRRARPSGGSRFRILLVAIVGLFFVYFALGLAVPFRAPWARGAVAALLGAGLALYAADALKLKRIAVIDDRTAYGQGVADVFKNTAKSKGITTTDLGELATNEKVLAEVEAGVKKTNARFSQDFRDSLPLVSGNLGVLSLLSSKRACGQRDHRQ